MISWCGQQKRGITVVEPNEALARAYIQKAEEALRAATTLRDNRDWEISASYYTMYFSLYAILMKLGIKSEIHTCTLAIMKELLQEYFSKEEAGLLDKSRKARIDAQYYSERNISEERYKEIREQRVLFLIKCKEVLHQLTEENVKAIRKTLSARLQNKRRGK